VARESIIPNPVRRLQPGSADAKRIDALVALKSYAIKNSFDVSEEIIQGINSLDHLYVRGSAPEISVSTDTVNRLIDKDLTKLDRLTIALTRVTYPITIENVDKMANATGLTTFVSRVLWIGIGSAFLCGVLMGIIRLEAANLSTYVIAAEVGKVLLALSLGTVGAILYVMLPNGKLNIVAGLDEETKTTNKLRIALGALLGFVLYVIEPSMFNFLTNSSANPLKLLIPLVGGYSVTLVIGILAKAVTAVEITLNLDEKKIRATLKRSL
jgi:hypothetical protein